MAMKADMVVSPGDSASTNCCTAPQEMVLLQDQLSVLQDF